MRTRAASPRATASTNVPNTGSAYDRAAPAPDPSSGMSEVPCLARFTAILPSCRQHADGDEGDQSSLRGHEVAERKRKYVDDIEGLHEARHHEGHRRPQKE